MKISHQQYGSKSCLTLFFAVAARLVAEEAVVLPPNAPRAALRAAISAQAEAIAKYPQLSRAGSPFHREFLARAEKYRVENVAFLQNERWPLLLAAEVAAAGVPSDVSAPKSGDSAAESAVLLDASKPAQTEAMQRYPALASAGSAFHGEFIARVRRHLAINRGFFQNERWPLVLAEELVAAGFSPSAPEAVREVLPPFRLPLGRFVAVPTEAPHEVQRAIAAGNMLQNKPYKWGGGHRQMEDSGYDCSGSVSYVLRKAGLLAGALTSSSFGSYGQPGPGRWITIYAGRGHVFMTVCGLRFDTGGHRGIGESGPRWSTSPRYAANFVLRHPPGL